MNLNGKNLCTNCFAELPKEGKACENCGYLGGKDQPTTTLPVGTMLLGRFVIGKVLGKGGFGVTYLSYDLKKECKVAIKEYMPDSLSYRTPGNTLISTYEGEKEESFKLGAEKFYEEAKTISKFNGHPNIINVYEFFYENNTAYFVMEYIEGVDLKTYLSQKGGTISEEECINLLTPIMDALIVIHSVGILHRDISPDNIYVTKDGNVKLLDFGAARQVLGEKSKSLSVVLKPGFAPIEQYQTRGKQGEWTDVYALAATMYFCLTGQIPEAAMDRIEEDNIKSVIEYNTEISSNLDKILAKALSVKAVERFQSISEFKQAFNLKEALPEVKAEKIELPETTAESVKKTGLKKAIIPIVAACIVIIFSVAIYGIFGNRQEDSESNGGGGSVAAANNLSNTAQSDAGSSTSSTAASSSVAEVSAQNTAAGSTAADTSAANSTAAVTKEAQAQAAQSTTVQAASSSSTTSSTTTTPPKASTTTAGRTAKPSQATTATTSQSEPSKPSSSSTSSEAASSTIEVDKPEKVSGVEYRYVTSKFSVMCTYTGEWKDGKPNGYGELKMTQDCPPYWEPGDRLSGTFVDGLLNGTGKYTGASGGSYNGSFKNGLKNGYGVFVFSDGAKYEGNFKDGEFHGEGTFTDGGNVWKGTWSYGEFQG